MKLCITSTGKDLEAKIDPRFGRATYFLIIDTEADAIEVIDNSDASQKQGAGIASAQVIAGKGVDALLTGSLGPNATAVLRKTNMKLYQGASSEDTIQEGLDKFNKDELSEAPTAQPETKTRGKGQGNGQGGGKGTGGGKGKNR